MDWARDRSGLSDGDLARVFKYEPKESKVARISGRNKECPRIDENGQPGLVLLIARRSDPNPPGIRRGAVNEHTDLNPFIEKEEAARSETLASNATSTIFPGFDVSEPVSPRPGGQRAVRILPFSIETFRHISRSFHIHGSLGKVVSRADIPVFSGNQLQMGSLDGQVYPSIVYNCRSSNAWDGDMAMTATYFPHCGLTFAMLLGCSYQTEQKIIRRLESSVIEAQHPLLTAGIFAEFERLRHIGIIDQTIDNLETKILDLNWQTSEEVKQLPTTEKERRNREKRNVWLDTNYLRNQLLSWCRQLDTMIDHVQRFESLCEGTRLTVHQTSGSEELAEYSRSGALCSMRSVQSPAHYWPHPMSSIKAPEDRGFRKSAKAQDESQHEGCRQLDHTGQKIKDRLTLILEEYSDKINDLSMRVDGMAMATQWAFGETNVEIALATSRDSQHMRSIALITMIFLPGTFFAGVFSMTFFDWYGGRNGTDAQVSKYIWIYIVVTVSFTIMTVSLWYYWAVWRPSRQTKGSPDGDTV